MAWNDKVEKAKPPVKKVRVGIMGVLALAGVAVSCVALFFAFSDGKRETPTVRVAPVAKKAKPAKVAKPVKSEIEVKSAKDAPKVEVAVGVAETPPPLTAVDTNSSWYRTLSREARIFKNPADAAIAVLLNTELGTSFVGDSSMYHGRHFKRAIDRALSEKVEVLPSDPPDVVELKKAVEETKEDLRKRRDGGEDVSKILEDARDELRTLGVYKRELEDQVKAVLRSNDNKFTQKDIDDLVAAANRMLHDRGVTKKIALPKFLERRALKWAQENKQE